ncbi:putative membrane protein [Actinopolymorpha cephalotaxi]|uniref:Membrane protein n=1 Tax=Actinopolymorpha cephalotaxi TaxID=504797 RepID=A0A1I2ZYF1_9ACTN|nr:YhgE/Pip domain-containing protein [Actinopolymorpha cephalotaxi]NYH84242.1 putative membrane protein [Actinopolymorpha cephalotaxi]SFH42834.1 putative membrane protein [Actinopolymorpha cephalotaxi]
MTPWRIALTELRRLTSSRMAVATVAALAVIPAIYAGLYLYGNHDPYGNMRNVPAALVMNDTGGTEHGKPRHAGRDVADELVSSRSFDWHQVTASEAAAGVQDGTYDFALTIPADFTKSLTSSARYDPKRAQLRLTTNDANSYLSTTVANTVVERVRAAIAKRVSTQAAANFLLGLGQIRGNLVQAADGATKLAKGASAAADGADKLHAGTGKLRTGSADLAAGAGKVSKGAGDLADGAGRLSAGADDLATGLGTLQRRTSGLPAQTRALASGARQVADGNAQIAKKGDTIATAADTGLRRYLDAREQLQQELDRQGLTADQQAPILAAYDTAKKPLTDANDTIRQTSGQLDTLASGARKVADGNAALAAGTPALASGISRAHAGAADLADGATQLGKGATALSTGAKRVATGADQLAAGIGRADDAAAKLEAGLGTLRKGAVSLRDGLRDGVKQIPALDGSDRAGVARTIGDPVAVVNTAQTKASNYGAGLAPFFMSLATWIGAYVLFLQVRALSRRALATNQPSWRVAVGGWLPAVLIGVAQVTVMSVVVMAGVGIVPAEPVAMLGFLLLATATFTAILHALNAWLGVTGQFLGLVLMVLQLITAGGTFPWQTIPEPLHWLHRVLPMSYAVDGLRQLMYGGLTRLAWQDVLVLAIYLAAALAVGSVAAHRQRVWTPQRIKPEVVL